MNALFLCQKISEGGWTEMEFDYFYGQQADMFAFFRIPKALFTNERFWNVSTDAKLLYGILLDRMNLSAKNGWLDDDGRVYIIYTVEEIMESLGCANKKAGKLLDELEKKCGLIEKKRQGLGKPNLIYVKNFISSNVDNLVEGHFKKCQNDISVDVEKEDFRSVEMTFQEVSKAHSNNTYINNTENNNIDCINTNPILSSEECGKDDDVIRDYTYYREYFKESLEFDYLLINCKYDGRILQDILELLVETVCSNRKMIRIASDDRPIEFVRERLMQLNSSHIDFVLDSFNESTNKKKNIRQYLLASLFNAPVTIDGYFGALVRYDQNSY